MEQLLQPLFQTSTGILLDKLFNGLPLRNRKLRQEVFPEGDIQRTTPGDLDTVRQCLWQVAEQRQHFLGSFQILLITVTTRPARIINGSAIVDTDPCLVGIEIILIKKTHIIGGHQWQAQSAGQGNTGVQADLVTGPRCALNFKIETVREPLAKLRRQLLGIFHFLCHQQLAELAVPSR